MAKFNPSTACGCCVNISPAWTVYHSGVDKRQHLLHLTLDTAFNGITSSGCVSSFNYYDRGLIGEYGIFDFSIPCVYSGDSGASWVFKGCPLLVANSSIFRWTDVRVTVTPLSTNLTGIYTGNTWIRPLKIEKVEMYWDSIANNISGSNIYNYDASQPWYAGTHHYCGHTEFSGALLAPSLAITPYIGYRFANSGGTAYLNASNISGSSVCDAYDYISGFNAPIFANRWQGWSYNNNGLYGDWAAIISGQLIDSSSSGTDDGCSNYSSTIILKDYDIRFVARMLPLYLNNTNGINYNYSCSGLCSGSKLIVQTAFLPKCQPNNDTTSSLIQAGFTDSSVCTTYISVNTYHGFCNSFAPSSYSNTACDSTGVYLSGTYISPTEFYNYTVPFLASQTEDYCRILYSNFFGGSLWSYFPSGSYREPMIIQNPVLATISIGNIYRRTDVDYVKTTGPCSPYLPNLVCFGDTTTNQTFKYKSKLYIAANSGRHITDDFDITDFTSRYTGSGSYSTSCSGQDVLSCEDIDDTITNSYTNQSFSAEEDDTNLSFIHTTITESDLCA